jgi:hypothetical protein
MFIIELAQISQSDFFVNLRDTRITYLLMDALINMYHVSQGLGSQIITFV